MQFSNPKRPAISAVMTILRSNTQQLYLQIDGNGTYSVPRCATNLIVPLLTHPKIKWSVIHMNGKRTKGTAAYEKYLKIALNEVSIQFSKNRPPK